MTSLPPSLQGKTIGILGGTGPQGRGLALRFAAAGLPVVIGSRSDEKAAMTAKEITSELDASTTSAVPGVVRWSDNAGASATADIVLVVVPWDGHKELLETIRPELTGKVVVDCVNPLGFDKQGAHALPVDEGSATEQAQAVLPQSTVVGAFHNVSAVLLNDAQLAPVDTDVLVLGDEREATDLVQDLASVIPGVRGVYAGRRRNAHQVEALTANLISVNRRYKAHAGLRVSDI
jgi:NADPH-dependent F420 reductase